VTPKSAWPADNWLRRWAQLRLAACQRHGGNISTAAAEPAAAAAATSPQQHATWQKQQATEATAESALRSKWCQLDNRSYSHLTSHPSDTRYKIRAAATRHRAWSPTNLAFIFCLSTSSVDVSVCR